MLRRRSHAALAALRTVAALGSLCAASGAAAGSICGTVRDAQTMQPVAHAAVFLFTTADQYTGLYAGTGLTGHYCIGNVPDGTYTLQVRVDDYVSAVVRNVVVQSATSVDLTTHTTFHLAPPTPSPAIHDVVFSINAPDAPLATLEVFDVHGRIVMGWRGPGPIRGRDIHWDFRDTRGKAVPAGVYLVRLRAGGQQAVRRLVRVR